MENKAILLSICIPTNGIVEWIMPVIESIYAQDADQSLFEVIVTDNGNTVSLENAVKSIKYDNFHYYRTNSQGFTNQIDAFEKCSGVFCKMQNHRNKMLPGSINVLLSLIRKYQKRKPILYCADGRVKGEEIIECANTDEFVKKLGLWTSWSAGTCVWQEDIKQIREKKIDNLFPHTVFLFNLREESEYVIWNGEYEVLASDAGKGGYDVFYAFSVRILDLLSELRFQKKLSDKTFTDVKMEFLDFVTNIYLSNVIRTTKYTYIIQNIRQSIGVYYGDFYYLKVVIKAWLSFPEVFLRDLKRKIVSTVKNFINN